MANRTSPAELVKSLSAIASPPTTYARLVGAIEDPFSSAKKIADVISEDVDLTARLLRIVNSSYYSFPRAIETVTHAVAIVGTEQLRDLTLATTVVRKFRDIPSDLVDMESFWSHSIACGLFARTIAYRRREPNPERLFVAGLLHDVGRLLIYVKLPDESRAILESGRKRRDLLYRVESDILRFDHTDVGSALMEAWHLPLSHQCAVRFHHKPLAATSYPAEVATVHVSDVLAHGLNLGSSGERLVPPPDPEAWEALGLPVDSLPSLLDEGESLFHRVADLLLECVA